MDTSRLGDAIHLWKSLPGAKNESSRVYTVPTPISMRLLIFNKLTCGGVGDRMMLAALGKLRLPNIICQRRPALSCSL